MENNEVKVIEKIKDGNGSPLSPHHQVAIRTWEKNENRECSLKHKINLNCGELNSGLEQEILKMKVGDIIHFSLNTSEKDEKQIFVEIDSVGEVIEKNQPLSEFERAEKLKVNGNAYIKDRVYDKAVELYEEALSLIEYFCDMKSVELKLSIMSNLALATLQLSNFESCWKWCQKYSEESFQNNKKIMYRKISALKGMKKWEEGRKMIVLALKKCEKDEQAVADFMKLKDQIEKEQKIQIAKEKKVYSNMFG